jgi:conjugal transfer pilus assembly protein TraB
VTNIGVMPPGQQVNPVDQWVGTAGSKLAQYENEREEQGRLNKDRQAFEARTMQRFSDLEQRLTSASQGALAAQTPAVAPQPPAPVPAPLPPAASLPCRLRRRPAWRRLGRCRRVRQIRPWHRWPHPHRQHQFSRV